MCDMLAYVPVCEPLPLAVCRPLLDLQVRYNLWVGAQLHLYSSSEQETTLRNMHEPNHRSLAISKYAARVADFLWPRVQDDVDEAIAKSKEMNANKRIGVEEVEEFVPPEVPHVLPFTTWCAHDVFVSVACEQACECSRDHGVPQLSKTESKLCCLHKLTICLMISSVFGEMPL